MAPSLQRIDHIHVYVANRRNAQRWYADVLGLSPVAAFEEWATEAGPLTIANETETIHLALFERAPQPCRSTIAFAVSAQQFIAWRQHLAAALGRPIEAIDHQLSWSLYFFDLDDNPYEITTYDYAAIASMGDAAGAS